jgi:hypothetical protein
LGAFGTGRVLPRSAGRRSSLGACPVVVPRAGRGLRGRDAAADEQRCESEIHVPHGLDPWRLLPCGNATKHTKFPRSPPTGPWKTTHHPGRLYASARQLTTIVPHRATARRSSAVPPGHHPACPQSRVGTHEPVGHRNGDAGSDF